MKKMNVLISMAFLLLVAGPVSAEKTFKYRVKLIDKKGTEYTLDRPQEFLSERALERRSRQQLSVDSTDLPLSRMYLEKLEEVGGRIVVTSKWNNTAVVEVDDTIRMEEVSKLPFVSSVKKVWTSLDSIPPRNLNRKKEVTNEVEKKSEFYGEGLQQIAIHGGDSLHFAGYAGKDMHVAVIDAGFYNADHIKFFKNMNLLGTRDFVNPQSDIYAENYHGMMVLSCMAANTPKAFVGTAPEASYWLLRSEDNDSEQPVEEDYWAAAVEFADSAGVDVINTSLGYYSFDDASDNYHYRDLNGRRSLMSNSASMVADKGMVLVCSAGNSGRGAWKKITPPADAEHVITVGALNRDLVNTEFSSVGNTADGRVKPDAMAIGQGSTVSSVEGVVSRANGTSFASPILCGVVTCFWQACPWLTAKEVVKAVQLAGDRADFPDNIYGYGLPNLWKAYLLEVENRK